MNLLGLPSIVQRKVLGQLEFPEFLLLSFTSTKAFRVMRSAGLHKTGVMCAFFWYSEAEVYPICIFKTNSNDEVRWNVILVDPSLVTQRMVLNGKSYDCTYSVRQSPEQKTIHKIYNNGDTLEYMHQMHSHLIELVGINVDVCCQASPYDMIYSTFFRNVKINFDTVEFVKRHIHSAELEKFLNERAPKYFSLYTRAFPILRYESKVLEIDYVRLVDAPFIKKVHLLNMRCSIACFWQTKLRDEDLIQFVNKWKEDTNNRLIFLYITLANKFQFNPNSIYEAVGAENWNPEHRPAIFDMNKLKTIKRVFYYNLEPDQTNGRDVRGRSGLIGTLSLTRNTFSFVVWH